MCHICGQWAATAAATVVMLVVVVDEWSCF